MMSDPQVQVFGPLQVLLGGRSARIGAGRQRAILGRLVLAGGKTLGVDRLVDDVWEGSPPPHAPSVLQVQIHNLRRILEPGRRPRTPAQILVSEGSGYALRLDSGNVDAWQFEALLRQYEDRVHEPGDPPGPLERYRMLDAVLSCWHGAAFESFAGASWATAESARLTDLRATAVEMRAQAALELDRVGEVVAVLRQQIEEYPGREETARLLALAQYRLGQQVEALATVRRVRDYLRSEYGIDPGPRLSELEFALLNHTVVPDRAPGEPRRAAAVSAAPARSAGVSEGADQSGALPEASTCYSVQRGAIASASIEARTAGTRLVWVVGDVGAGKTTLVRTAIADLAGAGWATAYGKAPEVESAPAAWVWREILAEFGGESVLSEDLAEAVDPFTIVRAVAKRCRELAAAGGVAIVLDDMHRSDTASLQVLRQLVSWLDREPVLIIVTARGPELPPVLRATEAALADRVSERVELTGLDLPGTREIAHGAGLVALDDDALQSLHRRTGGNPLFVRELSKLMVTQGESGSLPESIRAVLSERTERLPEGVLAVLQHIAVWGRAIDLDTLIGLSGVGEGDIVDGIDAAAAAGLVGFDAAGRITLDHALIRDTVYNSIPPLRQRRMHWNALEFLERRSPEGPGDTADLVCRARHAARGAARSTATHALGYVVAAALRCDGGGARADAAEHWQAAVALHELAGHAGDSADDGDRRALVEALCALTGSLAYGGRTLAARAVRQRAVQLASDIDDTALRVRALTCWRAPVLTGIRDWRAPDRSLTRLLESTLAQVDTPAERARVLVALVLESEVVGATEQVHRWAREAVDAAEATGDPELLCAALNALAHVITGPAMLDGWDRVADDLLRAARSARLPEYQAVAHYLRFRAACRVSDLRAASRHMTRALEYASAGQLRSLLDILPAFSAVSAVLCGDLEAAEAEYRRFDARMRQSGVANEDETLLIGALTVAWARNDLSGPADRLAALYEVEPELVAQIYAMALIHAGDRDGARTVFRRHPAVRRDFYWPVMAAFRARAAVALGEVEVARDLLEELRHCSGTLIGLAGGTAVFGPTDGVLADLADLVGDPAAAEVFRARAAALLRRARADLESLQPDVLHHGPGETERAAPELVCG
ncbi:BTAD domain-containing putative transcriptional regulator [Nocardia mexicana]|uniref:DNA-binding SARP family transcriptional activator n=2 Tax=Nocardia mexicana TaxID=279262 RepID=A0A370H682_9NOCA|nr:BTAD domain-containing putative transcriptional regulator [Nocardia mexicana]RDI49671.1 DNA-binding SARP family transcriptional activator [Nocardia mexicana]